MTLIVRAFPLKPECERADLQKFIAELEGERREEAAAFRRDHGVTHESWYLQETPLGPWVIAINQVDGDVQESSTRFAQSTGGFAAWFKQRVLELTGVDTSKEPLGPQTEPVYEWSGDEKTRALFKALRL
jgi:hypothetical protein